MDGDDRTSRRRLLKTGLVTSAVGLTGCLRFAGGDETATPTADSATEDRPTERQNPSGAQFSFSYDRDVQTVTVEYVGGASVTAGKLRIRAAGTTAFWHELGTTRTARDGTLSPGATATFGGGVLNWDTALEPGDRVTLIYMVGNESPVTVATFDVTGGERTVTTTVPPTNRPTDTRKSTPRPTETPTERDPTPTATPTPATEDQSGTFRLGLPKQPNSLNVLDPSLDQYGTAITDTIYEPGVFVDPVENQIHPWVFTDWTVENVDGDTPDVFVSVRDDLTWTDGEPFTVDDVVFTYDYLLEHTPPDYASALRPIGSVERASNDFDVHLDFTERASRWRADQLTLPLLPEHVWSSVSNPADYNVVEEFVAGKNVAAGLGFGVLENWGSAVVLDCRPAAEYKLTQQNWLAEHPVLNPGGPFLDSVEFRSLSSEDAVTTALYNQEIEAQFGAIQPEKVKTARSVEHVSLVRGEDSQFSFTTYNNRREPLDDVCFRQAVTMAWENEQWIEGFKDGLAIDGDIPWPPGFPRLRPEMAADTAGLLSHPAVEAFRYPDSGDAIDVIREFLKNGTVVDGTEGTHAGREYPGSLTGVRASETEASHEYTFGPVQSDLVSNAGADRELRVDGQTIPDLADGPLQYLVLPESRNPDVHEMAQVYLQTLRTVGIPVELQSVDFTVMLERLFRQEEFDFGTLSWVVGSPLGTRTIYDLFHSNMADDHGDGNDDTFKLNAAGYGLATGGADELIDDARTAMATPGARDSLLREALERIYLDCPMNVLSYPKLRWAFDDDDIGDWVADVPDPGSANLAVQLRQVVMD